MLASDLKTGKIFQENGTPLLVLKYEHIKVSRGSAQVKVRVRNLLTDQVFERSFQSTGKVEPADVYMKNVQYLYNDGSFVFMDPDTFEQFSIDQEVIGDSSRFLIEGQTCLVQYFNDKAISVELPATMIFEVDYTEPGFKGNTVSNASNNASLCNRATT